MNVCVFWMIDNNWIDIWVLVHDLNFSDFTVMDFAKIFLMFPNYCILQNLDHYKDLFFLHKLVNETSKNLG